MTGIRHPFTLSRFRGFALSIPLFALCAGGSTAASRVTLLRTPDSGIQPQAVVDGRGVIHLVYFKGDPLSGDIFYVRREPGREGFSAPTRGNSQPGSAIPLGPLP